MAEQTTISGSLNHDGTARVALDLLKIIVVSEPDVKPKDRAYYLKLMRECVKATQGQGGPITAAMKGS